MPDSISNSYVHTNTATDNENLIIDSTIMKGVIIKSTNIVATILSKHTAIYDSVLYNVIVLPHTYIENKNFKDMVIYSSCYSVISNERIYLVWNLEKNVIEMLSNEVVYIIAFSDYKELIKTAMRNIAEIKNDPDYQKLDIQKKLLSGSVC